MTPTKQLAKDVILLLEAERRNRLPGAEQPKCRDWVRVLRGRVQEAAEKVLEGK